MTSVSVLRKATPVLVVERIEPVLDFWKRLGLAATVEVPDRSASDGRLAFAILAAEGIEIMYQTVASVAEDLIKSASVKEAFRAQPQQTTLYIEVGALAEVEERLRHARLILPRRTTFYGATEVGYSDPAGNVIVFAQRQDNMQ
jgi:hypothetical protein